MILQFKILVNERALYLWEVWPWILVSFCISHTQNKSIRDCLAFVLTNNTHRTYSHRSCIQSSRALIGCSASSSVSDSEHNNLWPQFDPWAELRANARVFAHISDRRSENIRMREMLSRDTRTHSSGSAFPKLCAQLSIFPAVSSKWRPKSHDSLPITCWRIVHSTDAH